MDDENAGLNARVYLGEPLKRWCALHGIDAYISSNSFVYHTPHVPPVGPDFYVVLGRKQRRQSKWVAWAEDWRMPDLVIEFLSDSTEDVDRCSKMRIYQDVLKCKDYFLCDSDVGGLEGYRLRKGVYVRTRPDRHRRYRCGSLPLLVGFEGDWLRFFTLDGNVLPTEGARADAEAARADVERERAEAEQSRADAEQSRADAEQKRADAEQKRADAEQKRAEAALLELAALRRQIEDERAR